jgi:hypothetical protein
MGTDKKQATDYRSSRLFQNTIAPCQSVSSISVAKAPPALDSGSDGEQG